MSQIFLLRKHLDLLFFEKKKLVLDVCFAGSVLAKGNGHLLVFSFWGKKGGKCVLIREEETGFYFRFLIA